MSGAPIPWWGKIAAKIVLSRLPFGYRTWQRLGFFRHGRMDAGAYALDVFIALTRLAGIEARDLVGRTVMEIGPGDGIASALICAAYGARSVLLDTGAYARTDIESVRRLVRQLESAGVPCARFGSCSSFDDVLKMCDARYLTDGLRSMRHIPGSSVDLIFSQSVLEHVRKAEFDEMLSECRRVLKPGGVFCNHVDLKDHLGGGLNNLRFSESLWESDFFAKSGFYTNRIRLSEMLRRFEGAGFVKEKLVTCCWERLPLRRARMAKEFQALTDDDLTVSAFDIVLRRAGSK